MEWFPLCSAMCSVVQWLWKQRHGESPSTVATAVFLAPPEHMSIASVVMAIPQASVRHITTMQPN